MPAFLIRNNPNLEISEGPIKEMETNLRNLAHADIRHLQRGNSLFDFLQNTLAI